MSDEVSAAGLSNTVSLAGMRFSKVACRWLAETRSLDGCTAVVCNA